MLDEERLDPQGVDNLPHVLTTENKSSTFEVRRRVECAYYWRFNKTPVYSWLNFELKREQGIARKSM